MILRYVVAFVGASLASTSARSAEATVLRTLDRSAFAAVYNGAKHLELQNFDDLAPGTKVTTLGDVTFTPNYGQLGVSSNWLASSGTNTLSMSDLSAINADNNVTIAFSKKITAFAIDINNVSSANGILSASIDNGDKSFSSYQPFAFGYGHFIGFTRDNAFSSVTLSSSGNVTNFVLDTLIYGSKDEVMTAVPEPATWVLMLLGFGAAGFVLRRRNAPARGLQMV